MSVVQSNSEYTIYKTTTGELEARLMFQICEMKQTCNWDLVSATYRDHCKLPTDKMVWRHVINKYGKRILTLRELLIASTLSHPDTTIYLVEHHQYSSDTRHLDLIDIYGITGETILKMRQILEKYQVPLTEFATLVQIEE